MASDISPALWNVHGLTKRLITPALVREYVLYYLNVRGRMLTDNRARLFRCQGASEFLMEPNDTSTDEDDTEMHNLDIDIDNRNSHDALTNAVEEKYESEMTSSSV
ncbi:hypothetical protein L915_17251 [Phytophthora nicotianae]|uniref:Uncharacterized protein n=1 Tax=Phytophthora nicotianae TaxID=4792 RepID=W2FZZ1_PHYNI|nr:hypothetical protein L915_17251 [Phytophthora nicotianae]